MMFTSIAFFAGLCLCLYVTMHAWVHKHNLWCVIFILCTLFFSSVFVDHTFYGGETWQMIAEWAASK